MDLLRDLLDKQIVDRQQTKIGRVDGLLAELQADKPPRIVAVELGSIVLARRIGPRPGCWMGRLAAKIGGKHHAEPHRIGWNKVRKIGLEVEFDIDVRRTKIFAWQDWLRDHIIGRIPGA